MMPNTQMNDMRVGQSGLLPRGALQVIPMMMTKSHEHNTNRNLQRSSAVDVNSPNIATPQPMTSVASQAGTAVWTGDQRSAFFQNGTRSNDFDDPPSASSSSVPCSAPMRFFRGEGGMKEAPNSQSTLTSLSTPTPAAGATAMPPSMSAASSMPCCSLQRLGTEEHDLWETKESLHKDDNDDDNEKIDAESHDLEGNAATNSTEPPRRAPFSMDRRWRCSAKNSFLHFECDSDDDLFSEADMNSSQRSSSVPRRFLSRSGGALASELFQEQPAPPSAPQLSKLLRVQEMAGPQGEDLLAEQRSMKGVPSQIQESEAATDKQGPGDIETRYQCMVKNSFLHFECDSEEEDDDDTHDGGSSHRSSSVPSRMSLEERREARGDFRSRRMRGAPSSSSSSSQDPGGSRSGLSGDVKGLKSLPVLPDLSMLRIIVCEDDDTHCASLCKHFDACGLTKEQVQKAASIQDVLLIYEQEPEKIGYVVLGDQVQGDGTTVQCAEQLRKRGGEQSPMVDLITRNAATVTGSHESLFDGILRRPINLPQLAVRLQKAATMMAMRRGKWQSMLEGESK